MHYVLKVTHEHLRTQSKHIILGCASCKACSLGKFITPPSSEKIRNDPLTFLKRIQGDIRGPI